MKRALVASVCALALAAPLSAFGSDGPADAAVVTAARTVQRAHLSITPPIAQNGKALRRAVTADVLGTARFRPAREGRPVSIQRRLPGGQWRFVTRERQNRAGYVTFVADDRRRGKRLEYRAVARPYAGLARIVTPVRSSARWDLKFQDQFRGRRLDRGKWVHRQLGERYGDRLNAHTSRHAAKLGGGKLTLQVRRNRGPRGGFLNGHIGTQDRFDFKYGITAARIKFQKGRGQHGCFWLQPASRKRLYGRPAATGAEIDVAEFFGKGYPDGGLAHFVHYQPTRSRDVKLGDVMKQTRRALRGKRDTWWSRYHVFSLEWTPNRYVFRIDGVKTWSTERGISGRPQFLILSLQTSDWELPWLNRKALPSEMKVDWVRAWQR